MKIVREADGGSCDLRRSELNSGGWVFTSAEVLLVPKKLFNCKWSTKNEKKNLDFGGLEHLWESWLVFFVFIVFILFLFVYILFLFVFILFLFVCICFYCFYLFLFVFILLWFVFLFYLFFFPPRKFAPGGGGDFLHTSLVILTVWSRGRRLKRSNLSPNHYFYNVWATSWKSFARRISGRRKRSDCYNK